MYNINNNFPEKMPLDIDWRNSRANIIYVPFGNNTLKDFFQTYEAQLKPIYKNIIIPDKLSLAGIPVKSVKYFTQFKKELPFLIPEKVIKKNMNKPVIIDTTDLVRHTRKIIESRGAVRIIPEFFNIIRSLYQMVTSANSQLGASQTVAILDFKHSGHDIDNIFYYLKLNKFQWPQISDNFIFGKMDSRLLLLNDPKDFSLIKENWKKLYKYIETSNEESETETRISSVRNLSIDDIKEAVLKKFKKELDEDDYEMIKTVLVTFVKKNPEVEIKLGDPAALADLIQKALSSSKDVDAQSTFDELLKLNQKEVVFKKEVAEYKKPSSIGINALKVTGIKWYTDPERTKVEFDENLDYNVEKLIKSLDDDKLGFKILGIDKKIEEDGASRYHLYKIKVKPKEGRSYEITLKVPALVHGTYFKIGGNLFAINNQLMMKPLIKRSSNSVQIKTNYSVITYEIKSSAMQSKDLSDLIDKFIGAMKSVKKLKKAEIMDNDTAKHLVEYGVPAEIATSFNYKKIEIK